MIQRYTTAVRKTQREATKAADEIIRAHTRATTQYPPLTRELALTAQHFHANGQFDSHGQCRIWRRNGATQTWKRNPARFRLPIKYGLYAYDAVTEAHVHLLHTDETCPFSTDAEREQARNARLASLRDAEWHAELTRLADAHTIAWDRDNVNGNNGGWYYVNPDGSLSTTLWERWIERHPST